MSPTFEFIVQVLVSGGWGRDRRILWPKAHGPLAQTSAGRPAGETGSKGGGVQDSTSTTPPLTCCGSTGRTYAISSSLGGSGAWRASFRETRQRSLGCSLCRSKVGELFDAAQQLDLEGIVAKRKRDSYSRQTTWYKIKNPAYTQAEGRGDLFHKLAE